jgi:CheY-like chemotaxis protein
MDSFPQILIVEDNSDDIFLLRRQLAKAQLDDHVTISGDGTQALELLTQPEAIAPLVIFLDLRLPGLTGIELLRGIREVERLQTVPVIVITSSNDPADLTECNRLGVTAYLPKPVSLTEFIKAVTHVFPKAQVDEAAG